MTAFTTCQLPLPTARWLSASEAAAYVGVGADEFREEVSDGLWPAAVRSSVSRGALWDRIALDHASDQLSGVSEDAGSRSGGASPVLMTAQQAARLAGCSVDTINRSGSETLPRRGPGRQALFDRVDVEAFAQKERQQKPKHQPVQIDDLLAQWRS